MLEAAAKHGQRWVVLLEFRRSSRRDLEDRSWSGAQRHATADVGRRRGRRRSQRISECKVQPKTQNKPAREHKRHARKLNMTSITCTRGRSGLLTSDGCGCRAGGCGGVAGVGGRVARSGGVVGVPRKVWELLTSLPPALCSVSVNGSLWFFLFFSCNVALSGLVVLSDGSWRVEGGEGEL